MFEQQSYTHRPAEPTQEGDFLHNYEIKSWELGPRIYKILAVSAVLNLSVLVFIAQTDLLTRRGCDSPWAGRVCQVLDMAYVGTVLFGTERDFVDKEYEDIDLEDAEITFIDVTGAEPLFQYPADYDQYANPEKLAAQQALNDPSLSGYDSFSNQNLGNDLASKPAVLPTPNPNAVSGNIPDSPFSFEDNPKPVRSKIDRNRRKPAGNANTDQTVAQNNANSNTNTAPPIQSDPVAEVEINRRPMADLGNTINELREKNAINLESEFVVTGKGRLDKNGRLDPKTFRYGTVAGKDETVVNIVKESIEAINEAGYLAYIKDIIGKDLAFTVQQGNENIEAMFQSELDNPSLAAQRKSSLDLLISLAKARKQGENASQNDKDDLVLLDGVKTEVVGKTLTIKFVVPKAVAHPMIQRKLAEQAAEQKQPNGVTRSTSASNTAGR